MITSTQNSKIKNIIQLCSSSKARREQQAFIVEGVKMFMEAPSMHIKEVYVMSEQLKKLKPQVIDKLNETGYEEVSEQVFRKMSDTKTPQGIICVVSISQTTVGELIKKHEGDGLHVLILESIQDPGNLGTMLRTSEGAGYDFILANEGCVDAYNPKVVRATMGSMYRVPIIYSRNFSDDINMLRKNGVKIYAAHLKGENNYNEESYGDRVGIMIGNEGNGLTDETAKLADTYVKIPMKGQLESLNAAVAAAILMYATI